MHKKKFHINNRGCSPGNLLTAACLSPQKTCDMTLGHTRAELTIASRIFCT